MRRSHSSPVSFPFLPNLLAKGLGLVLSLELDDAELPLVEECGFGVEFGLVFELWEWECEEEVLESFSRRFRSSGFLSGSHLVASNGCHLLPEP